MAYREIDMYRHRPFVVVIGDARVTVAKAKARPSADAVHLGVTAPPGVLIGRPEWLERKAKREGGAA